MRANNLTENNSFRATTMESYHQAVQRAIQVMHKQLDEPLSLHAIARTALVSPYHFNRVFRRIIGIPPCRFLYALRLEAAKRLLLTTRLSVIEVCYAVGYNSLGTFTKRFTELVGVPPTRFRYLAESSMDGKPLWPTRSQEMSEEPISVGLTGHVDAPRDFQGEIFVGLFNDQIPQGSPVACTSICKPGQYRISPVPEGTYYLFTLGIHLSEDPKELFCYESALRGGGQPIRVTSDAVRGRTDLTLRSPDLFDPPILLAFPPLLANPEPGKAADIKRASEKPLRGSMFVEQ